MAIQVHRIELPSYTFQRDKPIGWSTITAWQAKMLLHKKSVKRRIMGLSLSRKNRFHSLHHPSIVELELKARHITDSHNLQASDPVVPIWQIRIFQIEPRFVDQAKLNIFSRSPYRAGESSRILRISSSKFLFLCHNYCILRLRMQVNICWSDPKVWEAPWVCGIIGEK